MNAVADVLCQLYCGEGQLADELELVSARHDSEPGVVHVAGIVGRWSREHVVVVAQVAARFGAPLLTRDSAHASANVERSIGDDGRAPGAVILMDLRRLYLMASDNNLCWEMLSQAAAVRGDAALSDVVATCHPQSLRQVKWAFTLIKEMSPQILAGRDPR